MKSNIGISTACRRCQYDTDEMHEDVHGRASIATDNEAIRNVIRSLKVRGIRQHPDRPEGADQAVEPFLIHLVRVHDCIPRLVLARTPGTDTEGIRC